MKKILCSSIMFLLFSTAGLTLAQVNSYNLSNPQVGSCGIVQVNGGFSIKGGNQGTAVDWDWGDGSIGRSFFPARHHFRQDGTYAITAKLVRGNQILSTRAVSVNIRIDSSCSPFPNMGAPVQDSAPSKSVGVREFMVPLRSEYAKAVQKIEADKAGEVEKATIQYMKNLNSILDRCMDERRLEDAIAVNREIDRVRSTLPVTAESLREGLTLHYTFDKAEPAGAVTDQSKLGNHGRASGAHWTASGQRGGGFEFDTTGNYITVPNNDALNSNRLTLAVWIRTGSKDKYWRRIFDKYYPNGFILSMGGEYNGGSAEGQAAFVMSESGQFHYSLSGVQVSDGRWHHVAATFDGQAQQIYVDGMPTGTPLRWNNSGSTARNSFDLTIGLNRSNPDATSFPFVGTMDDVMVFNRALSAKEILGLFESQATAPVTPMPLGMERAAPIQDSGTYSKEVTFRSAEKARDGFSQWSFLYQNPSFDPDARLEVTFLQPDGKEILKYGGDLKSGEKPGTVHRPYLGIGDGRADPSIFYNQTINVIFKVSKGDLVFDPKGKYSFSFYMGNLPSMKERATIAKSAGTAQPYRFIGGDSYLATLAKEQVVFIVPTHETDKSAEKDIHTYVKTLCDKLQNNAIVLLDEQALRMNLSDNGVIAYGTPAGNLWLAKHLASLPIRIEPNRIVAGLEHTGTDLRFMSAWPNPQNPQKALFVFTAQQAKDIVGMDEVYRKVMADFVVARGTDLLDADTYSKPDGGWQLPTIIEAVLEAR